MANKAADTTTVQKLETLEILIYPCCIKMPTTPITKAAHQIKDFFMKDHPFNNKIDYNKFDIFKSFSFFYVETTFPRIQPGHCRQDG